MRKFIYTRIDLYAYIQVELHKYIKSYTHTHVQTFAESSTRRDANKLSAQSSSQHQYAINQTSEPMGGAFFRTLAIMALRSFQSVVALNNYCPFAIPPTGKFCVAILCLSYLRSVL